MAFAIDKWLDEVAADGSLSKEEREAALKVLGKDPKIVKRIEEGTLRQSDYSRKQAELKKKEDETANMIAANQEWRKGAEAKLTKALSDLESERTTRAQYEARVKKIADEYGIDPAEITVPGATAAAADPVATAPKKEPAPDYVTREVFDQFSGIQTQLPAAIMDLAAEHFDLFGKPLKGATGLVKKALDTGKPLRAVWEEEFQVANRRDELAEENRRKTEESIRRDERQKVLSEVSLPSHRPDNTPRSPVFSNAKQSENRVHNIEGVAAAVRAYNERLHQPS